MITKDTKFFNIFTDEIFEKARNGILLSSAFIGAVLNDNNMINIKHWNIYDDWELLPLPPSDSSNILNEYKIFVVKNALNEIVMKMEQTLIEVYDILILVINIKKYRPYNLHVHKKAVNEFKKKSFEEKQKEINKYILNNLKNNSLWQNIKYIRNCITHNNSIVDKGVIQLSVPVFTMKLRDKVTDKIYISSKEMPIMKIGNVEGHDFEIILEWEIVKKIFNNDEKIVLSSSEIYFLIYALYNSIEDLERLFVNFLIDNKIEFGKNQKSGIIKTQEELISQYIKKKELRVTLRKR